jgi:hypothetical protein
LAYAQGAPEKVDVLDLQPAGFADAQSRSDQRDDQGAVVFRGGGDDRCDVVIGQVDVASAWLGRGLHGLGCVVRDQAVGKRSVEDLAHLPQDLADGSRSERARPGAECGRHGARLNRADGSIAQRRQDVSVEDRAFAHSGGVSGQGMRIGSPVFFSEGAERDGSVLGVDVAAGQLGRFNGGEETLRIDAAGEHFDLLRTGGVAEAGVPPQLAIADTPFDACHSRTSRSTRVASTRVWFGTDSSSSLRPFEVPSPDGCQAAVAPSWSCCSVITPKAIRLQIIPCSSRRQATQRKSSYRHALPTPANNTFDVTPKG